MKTFNKTRTILTLVLVALLAVSVIGFVVLSKPIKADAATTSEVSYVFKDNYGHNYYSDQYHNAEEIGFSLNTSNINNPYFDIYAFTYFDGCDYISVYLWFEGTTGPTSSTSDRDAFSLSNVGCVSFSDAMAYCEGRIYLSDLATLPNNTSISVYIGVCEVSNNGESTYWENIAKIGTITKYVVTQQPLPVTPTKTGYTFTGWYTDAACTQKYTLDYITGNVTLYAGFRPNTYTLKFDGNKLDYPSVTGSTANLSMTYDTTKSLPSNGFTNPGYIFLGWDTDSRAQAPRYSAGQSVKNLVSTDGGSMTLYAIWAESKYTVAFNANGGTGTMTSQVISRDIATALKANAFTKTGYHFTGWATSASGSVVHTDKKSVTNLAGHNGTITLYAVWAPNTYSITFNANGGTGTISAITATYDKSVSLPSSGVSRPGYILVGWAGSSRNYELGESVSNLVASGSIELKAMWTESKYTVAFNANGGTGTMSNQVISRDIATALTLSAFTRTGYTFAGWNTKADGTGTNYSNKQSVTNLAAHNGSITLYAVWTANTYTIAFTSNGGSGTINSITATYDKSVTLPSSGFTRTGYTLVGWETPSRNYDLGESVSNLATSGTVTLTAMWTANTYTVKFNSQGGSTVADKTVTYDSIYGTLSTPTRDGYKFLGWFTATSGGTQVTADTKVAITATQTLYAVWQANTYTVKFNSQGGSTVADKTVTYDSTYGPLSTPTRDGYKFLGWFTATSGGTQVTADTKVAITATQTLYARWQANTYTVVFNGNGNSGGSTATQTLTYDKAQALTANGFIKTGYHFVGWATSASGTKVYSDMQSVTNVAGINASVTLYAIWDANVYTVVFNTNGGTGSIESQTMTYDKVANLNESTFTRDGHIFRGWSTTPDGKIAYANGGSVENLTTTNNGTVTLYAVWEKIQCTITFIVDGQVYAVVTVEWGTPSEEVIGQAVNTVLYEVDDGGELPN